MNRLFLASLSAAALTAGATAASAQSGSASMSELGSVTCDDFLAMSATEQEDAATALTAASMAGGGMSAAAPDSVGEEGADRGELTGAMPALPEQDNAEDGNTGMSDSGSEASGSSMPSGGTGGTGMESGGSDTGSGSAGMDGSTAGSASPTVVALTAICENSASGSGGGSQSGATEN